jgi:hypothetical protein
MNKKVIESLAMLLKFDVEELTKVITTEEDVEFKLPMNLKIFTEDEYNSTIESIKDNHGKTRYDAGKIAGNEMTLKDMSEKIGLDNPIKDMDGFISTYKANILKDANIEPSKKIGELEDSLSKVQGLLTSKENELISIENSYKQKETKLQAQSYFPNLPENIGLSKAEATSLYFLSHEQKEDGIYKNGERQKDDHEKPFDIKQSIDAFVSEKKWNATPSGRGGGAGGTGEPNGKPNTMEEYESYIKSKGINPASVEANALLQDLVEQSN